MSAICVIPARGGSQRIPRKNIKDFFGKPIIAYAIETANKSGLFDWVTVSTDDDEIAGVAKAYGASIHKRSELCAHNDIGTQTVMREVLNAYEQVGLKFNHACCLYPCTPLLTRDDLRNAANMLIRDSEADYVVPVGKWLEDPGQFYYGYAFAFQNGCPLISHRTRLLPIGEHRAIDINTPEDWAKAEEAYRGK